MRHDAPDRRATRPRLPPGHRPRAHGHRGERSSPSRRERYTRNYRCIKGEFVRCRSSAFANRRECEARGQGPIRLRNDQRERSQDLCALGQHAEYDLARRGWFPAARRARSTRAGRRAGCRPPRPGGRRRSRISGLSRFSSVAATVPSARPASWITRRQPASPLRAASSMPSIVMSSPCERRSRSTSAPVPATVSRQPRLPQRQTMPSGWTSTWPSSPARPGAAAVEAAVEDQAGADAGGDLQVDEIAGVAAGAERGLRERAEVRVVVDHHRDARGASAARRRRSCRSSPAGWRSSRPCRGSRALVDRAREAHAGADHRLPRDARVGERLDHELGRHLEAFVGVVIGVERSCALGEDRAARGRTRPRADASARSRPRRRRPRSRRRTAGSAGAHPGRRGPSRAPGARPRGRRPAGRPRGWTRWSG